VVSYNLSQRGYLREQRTSNEGQKEILPSYHYNLLTQSLLGVLRATTERRKIRSSSLSHTANQAYNTLSPLFGPISSLILITLVQIRSLISNTFNHVCQRSCVCFACLWCIGLDTLCCGGSSIFASDCSGVEEVFARIGDDFGCIVDRFGQGGRRGGRFNLLLCRRQLV
jgi:hypothetical protein